MCTLAVACCVIVHKRIIRWSRFEEFCGPASSLYLPATRRFMAGNLVHGQYGPVLSGEYGVEDMLSPHRQLAAIATIVFTLSVALIATISQGHDTLRVRITKLGSTSRSLSHEFPRNVRLVKYVGVRNSAGKKASCIMASSRNTIIVLSNLPCPDQTVATMDPEGR